MGGDPLGSGERPMKVFDTGLLEWVKIFCEAAICLAAFWLLLTLVLIIGG
jgi:hypothetical protein